MWAAKRSVVPSAFHCQLPGLGAESTVMPVRLQRPSSIAKRFSAEVHIREMSTLMGP